MPECHKCHDFMKHQGEAWESTPCAKCQLNEDSRGTFEYREADPANASWDLNPDDELVGGQEVADEQRVAPFENIDPDDPSVPLSVLADAMRLWISLSLPARKVIQMRMNNIPYSEIGKRLGCSRQAAEKIVAIAIEKDAKLNNLLPQKRQRPKPSLKATQASAIADPGNRSKKCFTASQKPIFTASDATRSSA